MFLMGNDDRGRLSALDLRTVSVRNPVPRKTIPQFISSRNWEQLTDAAGGVFVPQLGTVWGRRGTRFRLAIGYIHARLADKVARYSNQKNQSSCTSLVFIIYCDSAKPQRKKFRTRLNYIET